MRYRVTFTYWEPTYARSTGRPARQYTGSFVVEAASPEHAEAVARHEFHRVAALSSVGWVREILSARCVPLADEDA